ncbi:NAD(P)-binding protein [Penicillium maclennaniae]|uniref:NAD(P)-binding protein n=1 Tax=Penicillium maclennaniae TaxID=1343394 RepID=UPI002540BCFC|nr:NAD(P)-binding protein [Penicillium maclennaniae]KAJ5674637.1 NAD(P)-binding protein [Penicillium maclennaniae]
MTHLLLEPSLLDSLAGKVAVLTGGATGIGHSTVQQLCKYGAKVIFGDILEEPSRQLESELSPNVHFVKCDASSYSDQLGLFKSAHDKFGRVDIVIANAGISITKDIFDPAEDITQEPSMKEIDINTKGAIFSARIGMHYLRQAGGGDLVLVSSIAGFKECGGAGHLHGQQAWRDWGDAGPSFDRDPAEYQGECHFKFLIVYCLSNFNDCLGTRMVLGIEKGWYERGLPVNEPEDVGRAILICATANRGTDGLTHQGARLPFAGKIVYVSGGESYEIEDGIQKLEPNWLGKENSQILEKGQEYLASDSTSWDESKLS